jgi:hypothetical protein
MCCSMYVRPTRLKEEREKKQKKMNIVSRTDRRRTSREKQKERKRIDQKMTMREREWAIRST